MTISLPWVDSLLDAHREWVYHPLDIDFFLMQLAFFLVLMHVAWFFEDKSKPEKASNLFTLIGAVICGGLAVAFIITQDYRYAMSSHAGFVAGMIMDMAYGYIYFPKYMDPLTTTVHHIGYFLIEYYLFKTNRLVAFTLYFPQEIPTVQLNAKRYWHIKSHMYELLFGATFFALRIIYYFMVSLLLYKEIVTDGVFMFMFFGVGFLHCYWFYGWIRKMFFPKKRKVSNDSKEN